MTLTFQGEHHLFAEVPEIRWRAINEAATWIASRCGNNKGPLDIIISESTSKDS